MEMMERRIYCEVELNGVNCPKRCDIPRDLSNADPLTKMYVKQYFENFGYEVGSIKIQ